MEKESRPLSVQARTQGKVTVTGEVQKMRGWAASQEERGCARAIQPPMMQLAQRDGFFARPLSSIPNGLRGREVYHDFALILCDLLIFTKIRLGYTLTSVRFYPLVDL